MRLDFYVEGFISRDITVDGDDSESSLLEIMSSSLGQSANLIMTDGITFGGFNLIDPESISRSTGKPVVTITRKMPDIDTMKSAIMKHLGDKKKVEILEGLTPERIETGSGAVLYCNYSSITKNDVKRLLTKTIRQGYIPEPVRMASLVGRLIRFAAST